MALENPITSDDLTIDFASLLDLSVSDRVQAAASDTGFAQALMASLTPIQLAKAFPDYYRKELPDISNFILANRYLDKVGKGGFDQQGGGDYGPHVPLYDGETAIPAGQNPTGVPEPSIEEMQAKLLEKGIDVNKIYDAISNGLSADDPQVQFMKNMSADKLAAMGIEQFKDDTGKVMFRKAPELSDQEVSNKISGKFVAKENASEKQKAVIDFASRWNISPQAAAGVLKIESGITSDIAGGASGNYHGVFQLQTEQIRGLTEKAGFGSLTPAQYRKLSVADQLKVMDEYYKQAGITPEFFTGDPKTDASKMWALQLAPGNAKKIDYNNPNAVISQTDQASTIEARNSLVTVGSAGTGSVSGGEEFLGDSFTRIEGNATPEQIAEFRKQQTKTQKEVFTREKFHQAAPTSIEYAQTSFDGKGISILHGQSDTFAARSSSGVKAAGIENVDPRLVTLGDAAIRTFEKMNPGYTVRVISGKRTEATNTGSPTSRHLRGGAVDYEIVDPDGNALPNLGGGDSGARSEAGFYAPKYEEFGRYMEAARLNLAKDDPRYAENQVVAGMHFGGNWWMDSMHMQLGGKGALGDLYSGFKSPEQLRREGQPEVIVQAVENAIKAGANKSINEDEMQQLSNFLYSEGEAPIEVIQKVNPVIAEKLQRDIEQKEKKSTEQVAVATPTSATQTMVAAPTPDPTQIVVPAPTQSAEAEPTPAAEPIPTIPTPAAEPAPSPAAEPAPAPAAEPAPTPVGPVGGPEEAPKFRTGGSPDVQDDENLSVFDEDGSLKWKMNSGEGIYVKPKDNEYADEKMDELSSRVDDIDQRTGPQEQNQPKTAPDKANPQPEKNWQPNASVVTYSIGSQNRAFKRTKFQNEGFHFSRSAPNSISS